MTFKAVVKCNGKNCSKQYEMAAPHPGFTANEYYKLETKGWIVDENLRDFCPACATKKLNN